MKYVAEHENYYRNKLTKKGYSLVAPKSGCYKNLSEAEYNAKKHNDSYIVGQSRQGKATGYVVYAKKEV